MPHDRKGKDLAEGDLVHIRVRPVRSFQVDWNPEHPEEYAPVLQVRDGGEDYVQGKVLNVYECEDACDIDVEVLGGVWPYSINSRLVEKVER